MRSLFQGSTASAGPDDRYRPDLDGLRGYAVVIAVLFHYGLGVPGGFIGPEIFFVISGYLIGGIVFRAADAGTFSFGRFLEFRIRRVAPAALAALAMIIPCLLIGYWILLPRKFARLAESALANLYFGANHLFLSQSGYFDPTSEFKPLLHTWSLAVEEQFYFVFPLLALILTRYARIRRRAWLGGLILLLFAVTLWITRENRDAAYFLAISRAWEFLLGVLVVLMGAPDWSQRVRNAVSALGVAVLLACSVFYDRSMAYPGLAVVLPCLATAAIIRAGTGGQARVNRWIGAAPQRGVGLISYSFYIWHWPLLVFLQIWTVAPLPLSGRWAAFLLSLAIAVLSWRYVEEPFRARAAMPRRRLYGWIGGAALVVLLAGLSIDQLRGLPGRWQDDPQLVAVDQARYKPDACYVDTWMPKLSADPDRCHRGDPAAPATILLWGDSHARQWSAALDSSARAHGAGAVLASAAGCPPILGHEPVGRKGCAAINQQVIEWLAAHPQIETVILASRWSRYDAGADLAIPVDRTLAAIAALGRKLILMAPSPTFRKPVPVMLARLSRVEGQRVEVDVPEAYTWHHEDQRSFERLFAARGLPLLDPWPLLCTASGCRIRAQGEPLYIDELHLTDAASAQLGRLFDPLFTK